MFPDDCFVSETIGSTINVKMLMNSNAGETFANGISPASPEEEAAPQPDERPSEKRPLRPVTEPILFFDGVCGLCNRFVNFALPRDQRQSIRFAPLQGETAQKYLDSDEVESLKTLVLIDERGVHRYSTAVVRVLLHFSLGWRLLAGLLWLIPKPLRDLGYKLVAANRYRLFGKRETCRLPSAAEQERFLP